MCGIFTPEYSSEEKIPLFPTCQSPRCFVGSDFASAHRSWGGREFWPLVLVDRRRFSLVVFAALFVWREAVFYVMLRSFARRSIHSVNARRCISQSSLRVVDSIRSARRRMHSAAAYMAHDFLVSYYPSHWIQGFILWQQQALELSGWASIAATTWIFRTAFLPLNIDLTRNAARLYTIRNDLERLATKLEDTAIPIQDRVEVSKEMEELMKRNQCSPYRGLFSPFLMAPVFLSVFFAVEGLSELYEPMKTGGALWFLDLSAADPLFILPVVSCLSWLLSFEVCDRPML